MLDLPSIRILNPWALHGRGRKPLCVFEGPDSWGVRGLNELFSEVDVRTPSQSTWSHPIQPTSGSAVLVPKSRETSPGPRKSDPPPKPFLDFLEGFVFATYPTSP